MAETFDQTLSVLISKVGDYPEQAYHFVRAGLSYAVRRVHGPESPPQQVVMGFLAKHKLDLEQLRELQEAQKIPARIKRAIDRSGGLEKLNRHVSGADLCWGLREYALQRWGRLATMVLGTWNIRGTLDFGRLVFAMIDHDLMQKQPSDRLEDFDRVYDFAEALDRYYNIRLDSSPSE